MQHVESLREVKRAEEEVRRLKEEAARKAAEEVRAAERRATEAIETAKADAETAYEQGIGSAQEAVQKERARLLAEGRSQADAILAKVGTPDFEKAVDVVLANFEKRASGR